MLHFSEVQAETESVVIFSSENWNAEHVHGRNRMTYHYVMCQCFFLCFVTKNENIYMTIPCQEI